MCAPAADEPWDQIDREDLTRPPYMPDLLMASSETTTLSVLLPDMPCSAGAVAAENDNPKVTGLAADRRQMRGSRATC
jgi:hypothetical protein